MAPFLFPVKVDDNELLPALLEELPHLHISPHTLGRMWKRQMQQVDGLRSAASPAGRRRAGKLGGQVGRRPLSFSRNGGA